MNRIGRTPLTVLLIVWLVSPAPRAGAMDVDDAPESVTLDYLQELYEAVEFDHGMHTDMFTCSACHHHTTGETPANDSCSRCHANPEPADDVACSGCHEQNQTGITPSSDGTSNLYHIDKPSLKGALHLQCVGCHESESGPVGCFDCHSFTPAGEKRFKIKK